MKTLLISLLLAATLAAKEIPAQLAMKTAASAFLASLDDEKRAKATFPFTSDERENYRFTPRERAGLPLKEMDAAQRKAALALLKSALSDKGALKATQIMSLESILAVIENNPVRRDPEKYFVSIFGTPAIDQPWAWRFEGHHLAVNVAIIGDKGTSVTPSFMGTNPAEVREGEHKGLRPLAAEEDLARALAVTLVESGKKEVIFSDSPPGEILSAENRVATQLETVGIPAAGMTAAQNEALIAVISEYTGRFRADLAGADMAKIRKAGLEKIHFGWAGSLKPGEAYYYRVQGPTFLLEGANTQNNANHMHAAWRDFEGDFARDLLKEHYHDHE